MSPSVLSRSVAELGVVREVLGIGSLIAGVFGALLRTIAQGRFPLEEYVRQTWFTVRVCTLPALAVSIPFGVILALQVGVLAQEVGATGFTGAGNTLAVVRQAAPMITALMLAGVAGSAICADLGSRRIREEIDALEVMGVRVVDQLVLPRALSTVTVAVLLNGVVVFFSIMTTLLVSVVVQDLSAGGYLASAALLTDPTDLMISMAKAAVFGFLCAIVSAHVGLGAKHGPAGVSDAVTRAVVANFVVLFAANLVLSQVATIIMGGGL
ncbi:MAG: transporter permease [Aeromicrobium sp.]|uniref:MlaE family ABC transporter permease n=1 Tax=Aeromicrobium sp. TaxID=1871063 RepID=UPI00261CE9AF|nr:ABC transporter permease [Aeromicrobium sp.]MCW2789245.1 transporter permease [Aeromicrobium sp.]MCW2824909.1 transporter permease [Aeromicrobium sp.]